MQNIAKDAIFTVGCFIVMIMFNKYIQNVTEQGQTACLQLKKLNYS